MLKHYYNGTLLTTAVLLDDEKGISAHATVGQVDTSTIYVQDPTAAYDFVPYKVWKMVEDACPAGNQVVWHGYVGDTAITRKAGAGYQVGSVARIWEIELIEDNGWPSRQVIIAASADRPAETVSARITWVLTMRGMTGIIYDHGLVEACTTTLDATDYRNRTAKDVLDDCALLSGYNWFVRYREVSDDIELIFQAPTSTADPASLTISNVTPNLTTEWPPNPEARQEFGASRIASGILLPYQGGTDYDQDTATAVTFGTVDQTAPTSAVKTKTKARAQIARLLAQHDEQDVSIENVRLQIPAAKLNDVKQGQVISSVKFSHFKSPFAVGNRARVKSKAFSRPPNLTQAFYDVDLSLSPMACVTSISRSGVTTESGAGNHIFPFAPTAGKLLIFRWDKRAGGAAATQAGWTRFASYWEGNGGQDSLYAFWKVSDGTETQFDVSNVGQNQYGYLLELDCACSTSMADNLGPASQPPGNDCHGMYTNSGLPTTTTGAALLLSFVENGHDVTVGCEDFIWTAVSPWSIFYQETDNFSPERAVLTRHVDSASTYTPEVLARSDAGYRVITVTIYPTCS